MPHTRTNSKAVWVLVVLCALSWAGPIGAQSIEFFPVDDLREGMRGVGRTVFHGTTVEEFDVEILGVLKNSSPKQDMVLARLSGGPLAETGVMQGMSGSPVYVDGKLVGAVAFAFPFASVAIAGIQPIDQMVRNLSAAPEGNRVAGVWPAESPRAYVNRVMVGLAAGAPFEELIAPPDPVGSGPLLATAGGTGLAPIRTPLFISGASAPAVGRFSGLFERFGFAPVQGGGQGSAASVAGAEGLEIVPGSAVNAELVRGDISLTANGTVTHVDGDRVYAFGHPFQSTGPTSMPMSSAYVITLIPNLSNSFKIAVPMDVVGAFLEDRSTGISGRIGATPRMIPVGINLETSRSRSERYDYEIVDDRFLTPFMMNFTLFNLILATERSLGESTIEVSGTIHLAGGENIDVENAFAGDVNGPAQATIATVAPIAYLMSAGFEELAIESIDLDVRSSDSKRIVTLDAVRVDRTEVRAGESVTIETTLRTPGGDEFTESYDITIPAGLDAGSVELSVGDGVSMTASDLGRVPSGAPRDAGQVLDELRDIWRTDRLYVRLLASSPGAVVDGREMPSLPPSVIAIMRTNRSVDSKTSGTRSSAVEEMELPPSDFVVQGQRSLTLRIVP